MNQFVAGSVTAGWSQLPAVVKERSIRSDIAEACCIECRVAEILLQVNVKSVRIVVGFTIGADTLAVDDARLEIADQLGRVGVYSDIEVQVGGKSDQRVVLVQPHREIEGAAGSRLVGQQDIEDEPVCRCDGTGGQAAGSQGQNTDDTLAEHGCNN